MRKKALVVDDNGNNLILAKDLLEVAGFERTHRSLTLLPVIAVAK
ncbi:MAG: hypothetical protein Q7J31_04805 [Syntrophales bacterium]|nr:hypothetical protein [Syntrophales bacterium]